MLCTVCSDIIISAIYYALLQSGYDFYSIERPQRHIRMIEDHIGAEKPHPFFSEVRQSTCEVYPYWPRAAILEGASFFLNERLDGFSDFDAFRSRVMSAANISDTEKADPLWTWLDRFPSAIGSIIQSSGFNNYVRCENAWIARQNESCDNELRLLDEFFDGFIKKYLSDIPKTRIVLSPIKCVYASDHHVFGETFVFTLGELRIDSIIHEFLHLLVHPLIESEIIINKKKYYDIDASYYLDRSEKGHKNAFEEYAVRSLTQRLLRRDAPSDLHAYLNELNK